MKFIPLYKAIILIVLEVYKTVHFEQLSFFLSSKDCTLSYHKFFHFMYFIEFAYDNSSLWRITSISILCHLFLLNGVRQDKIIFEPVLKLVWGQDGFLKKSASLSFLGTHLYQWKLLHLLKNFKNSMSSMLIDFTKLPILVNPFAYVSN